MKVTTLLGIEAIKTFRRRAFWFAVGFLTLVAGVTLISELIQGRRGNGAPFVAPFSWGLTASAVGPMPAIFTALTVVMLVTGEFGWRTARQNVIDGLSKEQFFVAKWLMTMMVTLVFTAVPFTIATGTALYGRIAGATPVATDSASVRATSEPTPVPTDSTRQAVVLPPDATAADSARAEARRKADSTQAALRQALRDVRQARPRPVYPAPDPAASLVSLSDVRTALGFSLGSLGMASMAFMLAMLLRSTGGGIGVFFLYFTFLEQLLGLLIRRVGGQEFAQTVVPYLPQNAFRGPMDPRVWHPELLERINAVGASVGQAPRPWSSP